MGINLTKSQTIDLTKPSGDTLTNVRMGLGWDAKTITRKGIFGGTKTVQHDIDLDASALLLDANGDTTDHVAYDHLRSTDGSARHTGDNLTGAGDGDDESILVDLSRVPSHVDKIAFVVTSYSRDAFNDIDNAYVRVVDSDRNDEEVARYTLSGGEARTALVIAVVARAGQGWTLTAVGEYADGRVARDLQGTAKRIASTL